MGESLKVIFITLLITAASPAAAVNWEGHENFYMEAMPVPEFTEGVAPPLLKPLPTCDERRKKHASNSYEQAAIVGLNCKEQSPKTMN